MTGTFFILAHPFLTLAFGAGTAIALMTGLVGYPLVLRGQVFAADALSHVAFTGALAALAFGVDLRLGLYGGCIAFALLLAALVWADRQSALAAQKRKDGAVTRQMTRLQSIKDTEADKAQKVTDVQDVLHRAFGPAQPLSDIAAVVADSLPRGAWLTGLGLERGKPVEIRGAARSSSAVPQLVHTLGNSPRFRDVRLVFANGITVGKARATEFEISAVAVGSLPLSAPDKAKSPQPADAAASENAGGGG